MSRRKSNWIIGLTVTAVVAGLLVYPRFRSQNGDAARAVPCLLPNIPLVQHIHPKLSIFVDGKPEAVPANVGLSPACERALHTHDETGELHIEAQDRRAYTFGDFLSVWSTGLEREGYVLRGTVDNVAVAEPDLPNLELKDGQDIVLRYETIQPSK